MCTYFLSYFPHILCPVEWLLYSRWSVSEKNIWNHRFSVRGWYQVSLARSSKLCIESRSCQNPIFYFCPLCIEMPNKALQTVNKFITIGFIFVQTALNWANTCVYSMYWVDSLKPILATSRVILELNPFGILIRGAILTRRPMVPCVLKNSRRPNVQFSISTVLSCQFIQIRRKGEKKGREG